MIIPFNHTLAIIKPDVTKRHLEGSVLKMILDNGFEIAEMKTITLSKEQVELFYEEHKGKDFFEKLVDFMTSNKVLVLNLRKENAVKEWREFIGSTNPENRSENTLRSKFALSYTENSVHGSDSTESAIRELDFFNFEF